MEKGRDHCPRNWLARLRLHLDSLRQPCRSKQAGRPCNPRCEHSRYGLCNSRISGFCISKIKTQKEESRRSFAFSIKCETSESRVAEALPWLLLKYLDLDWDSLVSAAKARDLQNRLGLVTCVARRVAEKRGEKNKVELLRKQERVLERSRLFLEDTLCNDSLTRAERRWLETNRPDEAKHWRALTDLSAEHLSYVG